MDPRKQAMMSVAKRVGLSDEAQVIRKALELERLLATKLTAGANMSDRCRNILCLDLAASALDVPVDKVSLIKEAGLKRTAYLSSRGAAEGLLCMRSSQTIAAVCLKMQCITAQQLAEKIIAAFAKKQNIDISHAQYIYMAVYQACRLAKIKVSKTKIMSNSGLRPTQWSKLEGQWTQFVDENFTDSNKTSKEDLLAKCVDDVEITGDGEKERQTNKTESYECWRERILKEAKRELKQEKYAKETTPRKSPRKREMDMDVVRGKETELVKEITPRKSPRKSESKIDRVRGARLVFNL